MAVVEGWKAGSDPSSVDVYDQQGNDLGKRDLRASVIAGKHPWDPSLDIVQVAPGAWVEASRLKLRFCPVPVPGQPQTAADVPNVGGVYGSGHGC